MKIWNNFMAIVKIHYCHVCFWEAKIFCLFFFSLRLLESHRCALAWLLMDVQFSGRQIGMTSYLGNASPIVYCYSSWCMLEMTFCNNLFRFQLRHEENIEYCKLGLRDNVAQILVLEVFSPQLFFFGSHQFASYISH